MINITFVFFIYGLAFFCMGLVLLLESNRSPLLAEGRVLRPLAIFGMVHGGHEWLEMFLDKSDWVVFQDPVLVGWLRVGILAASFTSLTIFALRVLQPRRSLTRGEILGSLILLGLYVLLIGWVGWRSGQSHADWLMHIDATLRYLLAVPGAILAGIALHRQATQAPLRRLSRGLFLASWGFMVYALTQVVVPRLDIFPADVLNTASFTSVTGLPIQLVRAVCAVWVTIGLLISVQEADAERQRQFQTAFQERLDAMQQIQHETSKREALRRELLRHTVIAQEDERARIARELHDETSQVLTAFALHLAALRDSVSDNNRADDQVAHLQGLSRQMAAGLYRLVHDLRPAQLDDLGLVAALQYLVSEARQRLSLEVTLEVEGERRRLDTLVETVCFRVAQEALTNVARHAAIRSSRLRLIFFEREVILQVSDEGVGFDPQASLIPPRGWGLAGMRERVEAVGGQLLLASAPGRGTIVEATIPLDQVDRDAATA
ncbi:MAG: sensor histidine kinase [Chloroflexota bacterium]